MKQFLDITYIDDFTPVVIVYHILFIFIIKFTAQQASFAERARNLIIAPEDSIESSK